MRVRTLNKAGDYVFGHSGTFNTHALSEVVVNFDEGDADSIPTHVLEVYLPELGMWKDMPDAMRAKDIITNNTNTSFFEPATWQDRLRGHTL